METVVSTSIIMAAQEHFGVPVGVLEVERRQDGTFDVVAHERRCFDGECEHRSHVILGWLYEELTCLFLSA